MSRFKVHRHDDLRICGATTVVIGQNFVKDSGKLIAVEGDINTDGDGQLIHSQDFVKIDGKFVIVHRPDDAQPDDLCPIEPHCEPVTDAGSDIDYIG